MTGSAALAAENLKSQITNSQIFKLEITTGNAPAQTGTTIVYKADSMRKGSLASVLSALYPDAKLSVDSSIAGDIKLILGK